MELNRQSGLFLVAGAVLGAALVYGTYFTQEKSITWEATDLHTVSVMLSEPMMRIDGGYHELLDAYYLKPKLNESNVVTVPVDDIIDELNGDYSFDGVKTIIGLNDNVLVMEVGSKFAELNGVEVSSPVLPEVIDGALYLPFKFVFESLGAKYTWDSKRERAEVTLLRPKGSMFQYEKSDISLKTIYKKDDSWFASEQAITVADAMLKNQNSDGGWFKIGSSASLAQVYDREKFPTYRQKSTIDNDATFVQIKTLAKVYQFTKDERYKDSVLKGLNYLLSGQLNNGGWPQFFPQTRGYHRHITFNDDAISNVLSILREAAGQQDEFSLIPSDIAEKSKVAMDKGIQLILDQQVVVNGVKTGWCAQYHFETLKCERGRSFELASISGDESVKVVKFLMSIEKPSKRVVNSISDAVAFLHRQSIKDKKVFKINDSTLEFGFKRVVKDKKGSTIWPRFIDVKTLEPIFSNRQGDHLDKFEDVSYERSVKYSWLVTSPRLLIEELYPIWQKKYSPNKNVL